MIDMESHAPALALARCGVLTLLVSWVADNCLPPYLPSVGPSPPSRTFKAMMQSPACLYGGCLPGLLNWAFPGVVCRGLMICR